MIFKVMLAISTFHGNAASIADILIMRRKKLNKNFTSLNVTITELIFTRCKTLMVRDRNIERRTYQAIIYFFIQGVNAFTPGLGPAPLYNIEGVFKPYYRCLTGRAIIPCLEVENTSMGLKKQLDG